MIGRHDNHRGIRIGATAKECRQANTGCCVSSTGFTNDRCSRQFRKLLCYFFDQSLTCYDQNLFERYQPFKAITCRLDHRSVSCNGNQLFGKICATLRPEPRAGATGHNDCVNHEIIRTGGCLRLATATFIQNDIPDTNAFYLKYVSSTIDVPGVIFPRSWSTVIAKRGLISTRHPFSTCTPASRSMLRCKSII